jgi:hypothetical protein
MPSRRDYDFIAKALHNHRRRLARGEHHVEAHYELAKELADWFEHRSAGFNRTMFYTAAGVLEPSDFKQEETQDAPSA